MDIFKLLSLFFPKAGQMASADPNYYFEPGYPSPSPYSGTMPPPRFHAPPLQSPIMDMLNDFIRSQGRGPTRRSPSGIPPFEYGSWGA